MSRLNSKYDMTCLQFARRSENPLHRSLNFRFWLDDIADADGIGKLIRQSGKSQIYRKFIWAEHILRCREQSLNYPQLQSESSLQSEHRSRISPPDSGAGNIRALIITATYTNLASEQQTDGRGVHERSRLLSYAAHFAIDFSHGFSVWLTRKKSLLL